ncbi:MAG: hypothetical protein AAF413_00390, partial [Patescibacteria group bacterium]
MFQGVLAHPLAKTLSLLVLILVGLGAVFIVPHKIPLSGQLRSAEGVAVEDGYYDLRFVGYQAQTGALMFEEDFADVSVRGGSYTVDVDVPRFTDTGSVYFQVCHSEEPSQTRDGLDDAKTLSGCRVPVERERVFEVATCPQRLVITNGNGTWDKLTGIRDADTSDNCTDSQIASQFDFAESIIPSPSITNQLTLAETDDLRGEQGEKGDQGEP